MNTAAVNIGATKAVGSEISPPPHIAVRGLSVDFTVDGRTQRVLNDINLSVPKSSFVSLIGPSGCGKSTLLKAMAGLVTPSEGEVNRRNCAGSTRAQGPARRRARQRRSSSRGAPRSPRRTPRSA